jgi:hypothetical protein
MDKRKKPREHFSFCSTLEFLQFQILIRWQNAGLKISQHGEKRKLFCLINEQGGLGHVGKCLHDKCQGKIIQAVNNGKFILLHFETMRLR